jgi:hypothetical protein
MTRFALLGVATVALAAAAAPAAIAASPYDGYWSVVIVTQRGACEPAYRSAVSIANGNVSGGDGFASVYGRVSQGGQVSVVVTSGVQAARGSGRLGRSTGSGAWAGQGSVGRCSGRWSAQRR